jgi:hypothetical protein
MQIALNVMSGRERVEKILFGRDCPLKQCYLLFHYIFPSQSKYFLSGARERQMVEAPEDTSLSSPLCLPTLLCTLH